MYCLQVILKMDKQGNGLEIDQCHLGRCKSLGITTMYRIKMNIHYEMC